MLEIKPVTNSGVIFCTRFIFFPLLQLFLPARKRDKMEKYFQNSLFYSYYALFHIFFFSPKGEKNRRKKMLLALFMFAFFPPFTYFFTFPPPQTGHICRIYYPALTSSVSCRWVCAIFSRSWWGQTYDHHGTCYRRHPGRT